MSGNAILKMLAVVLGLIAAGNVFNGISNMSKSKRIEELEKKYDNVLMQMKALDIEVKVRDSILVKGIEEGMKRIDELAAIRSMTQKQIDSLQSRIEIGQKELDADRKKLLDW